MSIIIIIIIKYVVSTEICVKSRTLLNSEVPLQYQLVQSFKKTWESFKEDEVNNNDLIKEAKHQVSEEGERREEAVQTRELRDIRYKTRNDSP